MSGKKPSRYVPKVHYTEEQLADAKRADLEADIFAAEMQAINGPFYPELGITRESLLTYAEQCKKELQP